MLDDYFDHKQAEAVIWNGCSVNIFPKPGMEQAIYSSLKSNAPPQVITLAYSQIFWFGAPHPVTFQAIIFIVFSINMALSTNSFGLDEPPEINRYLLSPLRGRDILLGKILASRSSSGFSSP